MNEFLNVHISLKNKINFKNNLVKLSFIKLNSLIKLQNKSYYCELVF